MRLALRPEGESENNLLLQMDETHNDRVQTLCRCATTASEHQNSFGIQHSYIDNR